MIKIDITVPVGYTTEDITENISHRIPIEKNEISDFRILKRRLNITDTEINYKMTVAISLDGEREAGLLKMRKIVSEAQNYELTVPRSQLSSRPVVVGSGPAGLFSALFLAEAGARPIVLERGLPVERRRERVEEFNRLGILDTECNIQFGEGGAGTYSDGKLKYGAIDKYKYKILSEFISAGADEEIAYSSSAHLGTDKLSDIVKNIREKIVSLGGEVVFSARLTGIKEKGGKVAFAVYEKDGKEEKIETENIILATGHSARDVFYMLQRMDIPMEAKGFGVGMRVEHPREYINELVYGKSYDSRLETASYRLVTHLKNGRSVYSFCMCPGGSVVAAASEEKGIVTNGMSEYSRMGDNSNAALLVSVTPNDFGSESVLAGIEFQRKIERRAYALTNSYTAPSLSMSSLLSGVCDNTANTCPTYPKGTVAKPVSEYMPDYVEQSLVSAISDFDEWMPGFKYGDAILTGPETRTTSPVRVLRDESYESPTLRGLYPVGEGAGYAGGIISSAVDGLRVAESILKHKKRQV